MRVNQPHRIILSNSMTLNYRETHTYTTLSILPISPAIKPSKTAVQTIKYSFIAEKLYNSNMQIIVHTLAHNHTYVDRTPKDMHTRKYAWLLQQEISTKHTRMHIHTHTIIWCNSNVCRASC